MLELKHCVSEELSRIDFTLRNIRMEYLCTPPSDLQAEYIIALVETYREHATDLFFLACNQEMKGNMESMELSRCEQWYRDIRLLATEAIGEIGRPDLMGGTEGEKYDIVLDSNPEG
ncbi:hypothetical protein LKD70_14255 [Ruminococcus sp. CLA-AA-H200]|uniref:Uncharacterized protein n=1 Tax=Ruminococcus turbiniformis TaxID=2881258 RepID=A0ABS8FZZ5_9FIRM|nr:hypothetical protein [Ruminococcus turbiniformis]MCC2255563.1 hypothetical protein [Ruminococcus turbiniformis]